jgi:hypothetical protein
MEWVTGVFRALHLRCSPESLDGRRNLGAFGGLYDGLSGMRELPEEDRMRILAHDLADAQKIGGKADGPHRSNAKIFSAIHNNRVRKYLWQGRPPPI